MPYLFCLLLLLISASASDWNNVLPTAARVGEDWGDIASSYEAVPAKPESGLRAIAQRQYFRNGPSGKIIVLATVFQFPDEASAKNRFAKTVGSDRRAKASEDLPDSFDSVGLKYAERTALFGQCWIRVQQTTEGDDYKTVLLALLAHAKNPTPLFTIPPDPTPKP